MPRVNKTRSTLSKVKARAQDIIKYSADEIIYATSAVEIYTTRNGSPRRSNETVRIINITDSPISVSYPSVFAVYGNPTYMQASNFDTIAPKQSKIYKFVLFTSGVEDGKGSWSSTNVPVSNVTSSIIVNSSRKKVNTTITEKIKQNKELFYTKVLKPLSGYSFVFAMNEYIQNRDYKNGALVFKPNISNNKFYLYGGYGARSSICIDLISQEFVLTGRENNQSLQLEYRQPFEGNSTLPMNGWVNVNDPSNTYSLTVPLRNGPSLITINSLIEASDYIETNFAEGKFLKGRTITFNGMGLSKELTFGSENYIYINGDTASQAQVIIFRNKDTLPTSFLTLNSPLFEKYALSAQDQVPWQILDLQNNKFFYNFNYNGNRVLPTKGWVEAGNISETITNDREIDVIANPDTSGGDGSGSGSGSGGAGWVSTVGLNNIDNAINNTYNVVYDYGLNQTQAISTQFFSYNYPILGGEELNGMPLGRYVKKIFARKDSSSDFTLLYADPANGINKLIYFRQNSWTPIGAYMLPRIPDNTSVVNILNGVLWTAGGNINIHFPDGNINTHSLPRTNLIKIVQDNTYASATYGGKGYSFFEVCSNGKVYLSKIESTSDLNFHKSLSDNDATGPARILFAEDVYNGLFFCESDAVSYVKNENGEKRLVSKERDQNGEFVDYDAGGSGGGHSSLGLSNPGVLAPLTLAPDLGNLQKIILHTKTGGMGRHYSRYHFLTKEGKVRGMGIYGNVIGYNEGFNLHNTFVTDITFNFGTNDIFATTSKYEFVRIGLGAIALANTLLPFQIRLISDRLSVRKTIGEGTGINGLYNNIYFINGNTANGWINNKYWINGVEATLDSSGTGFWNSKYYVSGVETTLPESGTGFWNSKYYISGVETTLNSSGTGFWNNELYINGIIASGSGSGSGSGVGLELINQVLKDLNFTGVIYGKRYLNGDLVLGWFENKYYINGVETTLNSSGTGIWNNRYYENGVLATSYGNFTFDYVTEGISITSWSGSGTSLEIPEFAIAIARINDFVFNNKGLTSVVMPYSLKEIGTNAFGTNQLTNVTIPNSVRSIGFGAFNTNQLTTVTIPSSVVSIGSVAFFRNPSLSSVNCFTTQTAFTGSNIFQETANSLTIRVRATDDSWTAGTGLTFQGNSNVTVIKDL